jgi:hypothetical protein
VTKLRSIFFARRICAELHQDVGRNGDAVDSRSGQARFFEFALDQTALLRREVAPAELCGPGRHRIAGSMHLFPPGNDVWQRMAAAGPEAN